MRLWAARWFCAGALAISCGVACGQVPAVTGTGGAGEAAHAAAPMVRFQFEREGLPVPRFRLAVREDGSGSYEAEENQTPDAAAGGGARATGSTRIERNLSISAETTGKIFRAARAEKLFDTRCASKAKNIADTGVKTLSYEGPDGRGSCTYNYSEDKNVVMLTDLFLGIAATMDEGRRIEFKRRYDRLGLDAELDILTQANVAGRAVELGTIAPLLRELANDNDLMQRVRSRAGKLLERADEGK